MLETKQTKIIYAPQRARLSEGERDYVYSRHIRSTLKPGRSREEIHREEDGQCQRGWGWFAILNSVQVLGEVPQAGRTQAMPG